MPIANFRAARLVKSKFGANVRPLLFKRCNSKSGVICATSFSDYVHRRHRNQEKAGCGGSGAWGQNQARALLWL